MENVSNDQKTEEQPITKTSTTARNIAIATIAIAILATAAQFFGHRLHQGFMQLNAPIPFYAIRILQVVAASAFVYYIVNRPKDTKDTKNAEVADVKEENADVKEENEVVKKAEVKVEKNNAVLSNTQINDSIARNQNTRTTNTFFQKKREW